MTVLVSSVDTVTTGLVALLGAQTAAGLPLAGLQVSDGPPIHRERESVYTYAAKDWKAALADFDGSRDESYTVEMAVHVDNPGDSAPDARARAFAILAAVGAVVAANPSIGGVFVDDQLVPREHAVGPSGTNEGYEAVILFGVRVSSLL